MSGYAQNEQRLQCTLETGELDVRVMQSALPSDELTGFAARNNARRGFLFVSKVLGKHWPVKPSEMQRMHTLLAAELAALDIDGPIFVVGMAETATALGRGVFEEFCAMTGMEGLYSHTTRYRLEHYQVLCFSEEHCHASEHWLHLPQESTKLILLQNAKTLVLVDDEMSTGTTFCNLVNVLKTVLPQLERIVIATLLDMTDGVALQRLQGHCSCRVQGVALLRGNYTFQPRTDIQFTATIASVGDGQYKNHVLPQCGGRVGVLPGQWASHCLHVPSFNEAPILVLGTGEFMYEPYRIALNLEQEGNTVYFQATTRSPILQGHDIHSVLSFIDNYGEHIDNFLYNVEKDKYGAILLCYETPHLPAEHDLPSQLGAFCSFLVR